MTVRAAEAWAAVECEGADGHSLLVKGPGQSDSEGQGPLAGGDSDKGPTDPGSVALRPFFPTRLESSPDPRDWGTELPMNSWSWLAGAQAADD